MGVRVAARAGGWMGAWAGGRAHGRADGRTDRCAFILEIWRSKMHHARILEAWEMQNAMTSTKMLGGASASRRV